MTAQFRTGFDNSRVSITLVQAYRQATHTGRPPRPKLQVETDLPPAMRQIVHRDRPPRHRCRHLLPYLDHRGALEGIGGAAAYGTRDQHRQQLCHRT